MVWGAGKGAGGKASPTVESCNRSHAENHAQVYTVFHFPHPHQLISLPFAQRFNLGFEYHYFKEK